MQTPRRRRQEGLVREALYIFLAIAIVMVVLLDGLAIFNAQQDARDSASEAGLEAQRVYLETGSAGAAEDAAAETVQAYDGGELVEFSVSTSAGSESFTVTVQHHADTYVFKYLKYVPGLDGWVDDVQNPTITDTTP